MGGSPQMLLIPIPESEIRKEILTIKFNSGEKSLTPKIIEVRLLNQTPDKN
jgi:hypothetical protein